MSTIHDTAQAVRDIEADIKATQAAVWAAQREQADRRAGAHARLLAAGEALAAGLPMPPEPEGPTVQELAAKEAALVARLKSLTEKLAGAQANHRLAKGDWVAEQADAAEREWRAACESLVAAAAKLQAVGRVMVEYGRTDPTPMTLPHLGLPMTAAQQREATRLNPYHPGRITYSEVESRVAAEHRRLLVALDTASQPTDKEIA